MVTALGVELTVPADWDPVEQGGPEGSSLHHMVWVDGQVIELRDPRIVLTVDCREVDERLFERAVDGLGAPGPDPEPELLGEEEVEVDGATRAVRVDARFTEPAHRPDDEPVELRTTRVLAASEAALVFVSYFAPPESFDPDLAAEVVHSIVLTDVRGTCDDPGVADEGPTPETTDVIEEPAPEEPETP